MFKTILRILTLPATSEVYGSSSFVASSSSGFNTPTSTSDPDMDAETQTPFSSTLLTKDVAKKMVRFEDVCDLMELEQRERLLNEFYSNPLQLT